MCLSDVNFFIKPVHLHQKKKKSHHGEQNGRKLTIQNPEEKVDFQVSFSQFWKMGGTWIHKKYFLSNVIQKKRINSPPLVKLYEIFFKKIFFSKNIFDKKLFRKIFFFQKLFEKKFFLKTISHFFCNRIFIYCRI